MEVFVILCALAIGLFVLAARVRYKGRNEKTKEEIRTAQKYSWLIYFIGLLIFIFALFSVMK